MIQKFMTVVNKICEEIKELAIQKLQIEMIRLEDEFHNKYIKTNVWHVKDYKTRRLWTPLGDLDLTRRIYENQFTGETKILFDEHIGLEPMLYIQPMFYQIFILSLNKVSSYKSLSEIFGREFSSTQISDILKRSNYNLKPVQLKEQTKLLFVNLDDIFVLQNKKKKVGIRSAIAYTGTKVVNGVKTLENKTLIPIDPTLSVAEQARELENTLNCIYGDIERIVIVGDAASWITSFKQCFEFSRTERYIDQFHFKKMVKDFLGKNRKINWDEFNSLSKLQASTYLLEIWAWEDGDLSNCDLKLHRRIIKWFDSYKTCLENCYPNAIEGIQSTQIARTHKNRRFFNAKNIYKVLMINVAQYNNWEIVFWKQNATQLFDKSIDVIMPSLTSASFSNIPGLENGEANHARWLNHIIHGDTGY